MSEIVHVHRSSDWFDSEHLPITHDEWDDYVGAQRDLRPESDEDDAVRWLGHPLGLEIVFTWGDGRVTAYDVDEPTLARLETMARDLVAVVQDDDCAILGGDPTLVAEHGQSTAHASPSEPDDDRPDLTGPTSRGELLRGLFRRP